MSAIILGASVLAGEGAATANSGWSAPRSFGGSSGVWPLSKWNNTLLCRNGPSSWLILQADGSNWVAATMVATNSIVLLTDAESGFGLLGSDELSKEAELLKFSFRQFASIPKSAVGTVAGSELLLSREELFGGPPAGKPGHLELSYSGLGLGSIQGTNLHVPYRARSELKTIVRREPLSMLIEPGSAEVGVLSSSDEGRSWTRTPIFGFESRVLRSVATKSTTYLLAAKGQAGEIWSSTKQRGGPIWSEAKPVKSIGAFVAEASEDTVHLCWLDGRKRRGLGFFVYGSLTGPDRGCGYRIYYRGKSDGAAGWTKEKLLSGRLACVGSPTISVEGSHVVVAWSNTVYKKTDIYCCCSSNKGRSWTQAHRVTDPKGSSARFPEIALFQGRIHLFYIENGTLTYRQRLFPTK